MFDTFDFTKWFPKGLSEAWILIYCSVPPLPPLLEPEKRDVVKWGWNQGGDELRWTSGNHHDWLWSKKHTTKHTYKTATKLHILEEGNLGIEILCLKREVGRFAKRLHHSLLLEPPERATIRATADYCNVPLHWHHHSAMVFTSRTTLSSFYSFISKAHLGKLALYYSK